MLRIAALFLACVPLVCIAQENDAGAKAFQRRDWQAVISIYGAQVKVDPNDAQGWYRYARGLEETGKYAEAITAFEKANSPHSAAAPFAQLHIAADRAALGQKDAAAKALQALADSGFAIVKMVDDERRFDSVRDDSRFQAAAQAIRNNAFPCKNPSRPEYRQFDFWVGDWDVFDAAGNKVGTSNVQLILNDCVVYENWKGALGGEGKSFNKYNPAQKQWEQYWVDGSPGRMFFTGHYNRQAARLEYETETEDAHGNPMHRKLTFFSNQDGTVRQFSQASSDGGKTYSVEYDFIYRRQSNAASSGR
jgi:hypothetical protein